MSASRYLSGTTIIGVRTPNEVVVATDSKMVALEATYRLAGFTCKIGRAGDIYFAHSGLFRDTLGTFDVRATISGARRHGESIIATAARVEQLLVPILQRAVAGLQRSNPLGFARHLNGKSVAGIALFGLDGDTPILAMRNFDADASGTGGLAITVHPEDVPGQRPPTTSGFGFLGEHTAIDRFLDTNPVAVPFPWGWIPTLTRLIEIEAAASPHLVGPPVAVFYVGRQGAGWLARPLFCPDQF